MHGGSFFRSATKAYRFDNNSYIPDRDLLAVDTRKDLLFIIKAQSNLKLAYYVKSKAQCFSSVGASRCATIT